MLKRVEEKPDMREREACVDERGEMSSVWCV
jgi:hypothetical protein